MQPSCTEPNSLDTKGEKERTKGGRIKRRKEEGKRRKEKERGRKKGGKRGILKKIGFCKFLLGLYKRILEKKVYICNIRNR